MKPIRTFSLSTTTSTTPHSDTVNHSGLFSNQQVNERDISVSQLKTVSLSPKYRQMNLVLGFTVGLVLLIMLTIVTHLPFVTIDEEFNKLIWAAYGVIIFFTAWDMIYHFYADPLKQYALREHDLNYQSGLVFKSLVSQPILRIQHIEIKRGPIERRYNLATLQVFSAGGVSYTFTIPGLAHENAIQLRQFVLDHKDLAADV